MTHTSRSPIATVSPLRRVIRAALDRWVRPVAARGRRAWLAGAERRAAHRTRPPFRRRALLEAIEPRLLMSADVPGVPLFVASDDQPQLRIENLYAPESARVDQSFDVNFDLANRGLVDTEGAWVEWGVWLSDDDSFDPEADQKLQGWDIGYLGPDSSSTVYATIELGGYEGEYSYGPDVSPGSYTLFFVADPDNTLDESDESDNVVAHAIELLEPPPPDLRATSLRAVGNASVSDALEIDFTIENAGDSRASDVNVKLWWSPTAVLGRDAIELGTWSVSDLSAGNTWSPTFTDYRWNPDTGEYDLVTVYPSVGLGRAIADLPLGPYTLLLEVDPDNEVAETNEDNNVARATVDLVAPGPLTDLELGEFDVASTTITYGEWVNTSYAVGNPGGMGTPGRYANRLVLSQDAVWSADDVTLWSFDQEPLDPNSSYSASTSLRVDPSQIGRFGTGPAWLLMLIDADDDVMESDETDNTRAIEITLAIPPLPDLEITEASLTGGTGTAADGAVRVTPGSTLSLSWTGTNVGAATAAGGFYDGIYLSADAVFDSTDVYLDARYRGGDALDPGATWTGGPLAITIPADGGGLGAGRRYVLVRADTFGWQAEAAENNNVLAVAIDIEPGPYPDIVVDDFVAPSTGVFGTMLDDLQWTVRNDGPAVLPESYSADGVWLSTDAVFDASDRQIGWSWSTRPALDAGQSATVTVDAWLPRDLVVYPPGEYFLIARSTTAWGQNADFDPADNVAVRAITLDDVARPDLVPTVLSAPTVTGPGEEIEIVVRVDNAGGAPVQGWQAVPQLFLSGDDVLDPWEGDEYQDVSLDTWVVWTEEGGDVPETIEPGASHTFTLRARLPEANAVARGQYRLLVAVDPFRSVVEVGDSTLEPQDGNNVVALPLLVAESNLAVTDVQAPASADLGTWIDVTWEVTGGNAGASWTDAIYLSADDTLDDTDRLLGRFASGFDGGEGGYGGDTFTTASADEGYPRTRTVRIPLEPGAFPPGTWHILVLADADRQIAEVDRSDNVASAPIELTMPLRPDLEIRFDSAPATGTAGEMVYVQWTTTNNGPVSTDSRWYETLWLSSDTTLDASDLKVTQVDRYFLASGGSTTHYENVRLPFRPDVLTDGTWYLLAATDRATADGTDGALVESDETNNVVASAIELEVPAPADLVVDAVNTRAVDTFGDSIRVTWTTRNVGEGNTYGRWNDAVYLSVDDQFDASDQLLASSSFGRWFYWWGASGPVYAPDQTYDGEAYVNIVPDQLGVTDGEYHIIVVANHDALEPESDRTNNARASAIRLERPELSATDLQAPAVVVAGSQFDVTYVWTNDGTTPINGVVGTGFWLSTDGVLDASDRWIGSHSGGGGVAGIAPGATFTGAARLNAPMDPSIAGSYTLFARIDGYAVDGNGNELEGDETDNLISIPIEVRLPDLAIGTVTAPEAVVEGAAFTLTAEIRNDGEQSLLNLGTVLEVWLSRDGTFTSNERLAATYQQISLAPEASTSRSIFVRLPATAPDGPGDYQLRVRLTTSGDSVIDGTPADNEVVRTLRITSPELRADALVVQSTQHAAGQQVSARLDVTDTAGLGFGAYSNAIERLWLSSDAVLDDGDTLLASQYRGGATSTSTFSTTLYGTLPSAIAGGTWYLIGRTDATDAYTELDETNNVAVATIEVVNVNLQVTAGDAPDAVSFGEAFDVTWTTSNVGTDPTTQGVNDQVWLSTDAFLDSSDLFLDQVTTPAVMVGGAAVEQTRRVTVHGWDARYANRDVYLIVRTDTRTFWSDNPNVESVETDNDRAIAIRVNGADLRTSSVSVLPAGAALGEEIDVSFTVVNDGPGAAIGGWGNAIQLARDDSPSSPRIWLGSVEWSESLAAGESRNGTVRVRIPLDPDRISAGGWRVLVTANMPGVFGRSVPEADASDNTASAAIDLTVPPLPNFTVSSIDVPAVAPSGQSFDVRWTITNTGGAAATGWTDQVRLVNVAEPWRFIALGGVGSGGDATSEATLAAGASIERIGTFTLPLALSGAWRLEIATDFANNHREVAGGEADNLATRDITVTQSPYPDLRVDSIVTPVEGFSGQLADIEWVVTNHGTGDTTSPTWRDDLWLSIDDGLNAGDWYLGSAANPSWLPVGASYTNRLSVRLPDGIEGTFRLIVRTDSGGNVNEVDAEGNNLTARSFPVTLTAPPDLVVDSVTQSGVAFSGELTTVSWVVRNAGNGVTPVANWFDRIYLSTDELWDAEDRLLETVQHRGVLAADGTYRGTAQVRLPIGVAGPDFRFLVLTDAFGNVFELTSDGNNVGMSDPRTILLTPPPDLDMDDLEVRFAPVDAASGLPVLRAGAGVTLGWHVGNYGATPTVYGDWFDAFWLSTDDVLDASDLRIGTVGRRGTLAVDGEYDASATFVLPQGLSGEYRLIGRADAFDREFELDNANNLHVGPRVRVESRPANLVVTDVEAPAEGVNNRSITVAWTVTNAGADATLAASHSDRIVLMREGFGSIALGDFTRPSALVAGASYAQRATVTLPVWVAAGEWRLAVVTDVGGAEYEGAADSPGELDNLSESVPITIRTEFADLRVDTVGVPATATAGGPLDLSWTVTNHGISRTSSNTWTDQVWLSRDRVLGGDDRTLGAAWRGNPLEAGEGYNAGGRFHLDRSIEAGDWYVLVMADYSSRVFEGSGESNNLTASLATVRIAAYDPITPDLDVTGARVTVPDVPVAAPGEPQIAYAGLTLDASWDVVNRGEPWQTLAWGDGVWLSRDANLERGTDIRIGSVNVNGGFLPGDTYTRSASDLRIPEGLSGLYYVIVGADASNQLAEANEADNARVATLLDVRLLPPTNLVAGSVSLPTNARPGAEATFSYTIAIDSTEAAQGRWTDTLYLSKDAVWDASDVVFGSFHNDGRVAAGTSYTREVTARLPGVVPGDWHVIVRSDIRNTVRETLETDNLIASATLVDIDLDPLPLNRPDDGIDDVVVTGVLDDFGVAYWRFDVAAGEAVRLTMDSNAPADVPNELVVRFGAIPDRGSFDASSKALFTPDPTLIIPTTQAGTYYVAAYGGTRGAQNFSLRADIVPFGLDDVETSLVGNAGDATLRITGARFTDDTVFELVDAAGVAIRAAEFTLVDASTAYATFDLTDALAGVRDVRATRPGLTASTLDDAVTVADGDGGEGLFVAARGRAAYGAFATVPFNFDYENQTGNDFRAALVIIESQTNTPVAFSARELGLGPLHFLAASNDGPANLLRPGGAQTISVLMQVGVGENDIRTRVVTDRSTAGIGDWAAIERALRPGEVDDATWASFWAQLSPRIGATWGDYVTFLQNASAEVTGDDELPVRDPREMMRRLMAREDTWLPTVAVSGVLVDSVTGLALEGVQVAAWSLDERGRYVLRGAATTGSDGSFRMAAVTAGSMVLGLDRADFDLDRDGVEDATAPTVVVAGTSDVVLGSLGARPLVEIERAPRPTAPILLETSDGTAHLLHVVDGVAMHAVRGAGGEWIDVGRIGDAKVFGLTAKAVDDLFGVGVPGLVAAWQQGIGNEAELWYALARRDANGDWEWSAAARLTDNAVRDTEPEIEWLPSGELVVVFTRRDHDTRDDTDLYYVKLPADGLVATWPAAAVDTPLVEEGWSRSIGIKKNFDLQKLAKVLGLSAAGSIEGNLTGAINNCKKTLTGAVQASLSFEGETVRATIAGNGSIAGEWTADELTRGWKFDRMTAGWGISGDFDWRYGLSTLIGKMGIQGAALNLGYSFVVAIAEKNGIKVEDGINLGIGASFTGLQWFKDDPITGGGSLLKPDSIGEASVSVKMGPYFQVAIPNVLEARIDGSLVLTADVAPEFKVNSFQGIVNINAYIDNWWTFSKQYVLNIYSASGLEVSDADVDAIELTFDPAGALGSDRLHGNGAVEGGTTTDLLQDSTPTLARLPDGRLAMVWNKALDSTSSEPGSRLMSSIFDGTSWTAPVEIAGSAGMNGGIAMAVDGAGRPLAVWTSADGAGLGATSTMEDIDAARADNDLWYSVWQDGAWQAAQRVATTAGTDAGLALMNEADGDLVVAWVEQGNDGTDAIRTASFVSGTWTVGAGAVATGTGFSDLALSDLGGTSTLAWAQGSDLFTSAFTAGAWTPAVVLSIATPLPETTAVVAEDANADILEFLLQPPDESCFKCSPEEMARLRAIAAGREGASVEVDADGKCKLVFKPRGVVSRDPNDILGPEGFGELRFVRSDERLGYTIRFENAADAESPAQRVIITQQLDADLDPRSFRVDDLGFADTVVELAGDRPFHTGRVDLSATRGIFVDVSATVDTATGIVTWTFDTIDAETGAPPIDPFKGFLLQNDETRRGEGFVSYSVRPFANPRTGDPVTTTGEVIDAEASIVFDVNDAIVTPPIFNTLDAVRPTSAVEALPATTELSRFLVRWDGRDDEGGSGVRDFTIWVSTDGGPATVWLANTTDLEAEFAGEVGRTYAFWSVATDNTGWIEDAPTTPDAVIGVEGGAAIEGVVFDDLDGDGTRDGDDDTGVSGATVWLDADDDGLLDDGERFTLTAEDGTFVFGGLGAGTVVVRQSLPAGWVGTAPASGRVSVTLGDTDTGSATFGRFALGAVEGVKFDDVDGDGTRDDGEAGLAGWSIYVDANDNGVRDAGERGALTGSDGAWRIVGVGPGMQRVREEMRDGWTQTAPGGDGFIDVTMTSGATVEGLVFGNRQTVGTIRGVKYEDVDGDGERDAGERGLSGWTIFLDADGDGLLDAGERTAVTGEDGSYTFANVAAGSWIVAEVQQAGWTQTAPRLGPAGAGVSTPLTTTGSEIALMVEGCACGLTWAPEGPVAVTGSTSTTGTVDLGARSMSQALATTGITAARDAGTWGVLDGRGIRTVVIDTGIDRDHGFFGPDADGNRVADRIVFEWDFANGDADASDRSGHGSHIASVIGSGDGVHGGVAPKTDLIALKVFEDGGAGSFAYLERALQWVVANADAYDIGVVNLSLGDGAAWTQEASRYGLADEFEALSRLNVVVLSAAGNHFYANGGELGIGYPASDPAVIAVGATWAGDFGGPWRVAGGATNYTTGTDHIAAFSQRDANLIDAFAPGARFNGASATGGVRTMQGTSQASAFMSGAAALAQQIARAELGRQLTTGEFATLLRSTSALIVDGDDENDNVENTGATYRRLDFAALAQAIGALPEAPDGGGGGSGTGGSGSGTGGNDTGGTGTPRPTQVAAPGVHTVTVEAGETTSDVDFGNFRLGTVRGAVFADIDGDGTRDAGEGGAAGRTVWLDADGDGALDAGELEATTAEDGSFEIAGVGPGSFTLRALEPIGFTSTTPDGVAFSMTSGLDVVDAQLGSTADVLQITSVTPDTSGVAVRFNRAIATDGLNVFALGSGAGAQAADVSLVHLGSGARIAGTLVVDADARGVRFVRSGTGVLPAGDYRLTLASRADGFREAGEAARLLDGDADGVAGGDAARSFTVTAPAAGTVTASLADSMRGAGQTLGQAAPTQAGQRWPIRLSDGADAEQMVFEVTLDATQIEVGGIVLAPGLVGTLEVTQSGEPQARTWRIEVTLEAPLAAGAAANVVEVQATVRAGARYGEASVVRLAVESLRTGGGTDIAAQADASAVVVTGYVGDADRSQAYEAADVQQVQRYLARQQSGFEAYATVDPTLIADVNASGGATTQDAFVLTRVVAGVPRLEVPAIPALPPAPAPVPLMAMRAASAPTSPPEDLAKSVPMITTLAEDTTWKRSDWAQDLSQRLADLGTQASDSSGTSASRGAGRTTSGAGGGLIGQLARGLLRR